MKDLVQNFRSTSILVIALPFLLLCNLAMAHQSSTLYLLDQLKVLEGTLTSAYFGAPHSRYQIEVIDGDGETANWLVIVQDPEDAQRFGYYEEVEALQVGDSLSFIGWPHSRNSQEILAHVMYTPSGQQIELVPPGAYIRSALYLAMDQRAKDPSVLSRVTDAPAGLSAAQRLVWWAAHDDAIDRAAAQELRGQAKLIGIIEASGVSYPGAPNYLLCQADREHAEIILANDIVAALQNQAQINALVEFVQIYNRVLSKYWELQWNSCGA